MTLKEVALHLRLAETTIARMARDGELAAQKFGDSWQFSRTAVDAWMAAQPALEQRLPVEATGLPEPLTVAGAMSADHMNLALQGPTKDAVLRELVGDGDRARKRAAHGVFLPSLEGPGRFMFDLCQ